MSEEHRADDRESFDSPPSKPPRPDSVHEDLPYGMAGVTAMLERLRLGVEHAERGDHEGWHRSRARAVADYLLSLHPEYWFSGEELAFCRRVIAT